MYGRSQITPKRTAGNSLAGCLFVFSILLSFVFTGQNISAQTWLNPSQTYVKLAVSKRDFHFVTGQQLSAAGLSIEKIKPGSIQIFRRKEEVAIEVQSKREDHLDDQSVISFFGEGNDGLSDSVLFVHPKAMPLGSYPLYSDTAHYFLTWRNDAQEGKRIIPTPSSFIITDTLDYHLEEKEMIFNSQYQTGCFYPSGTGFSDGMAITAYDVGEGWTGPTLINTWQNVDINTVNLRPELIEKCEILVTMVGRAQGTNVLELFTGTSQSPGRKITSVTLTDHQPVTFRFQFRKEDLKKALLHGNKLSISFHSVAGAGSVSYVKWQYPQQAQLPPSNDTKSFHFDPTTKNTFLKTGNTSGWKFYNVTEPSNVRTVISTPTGIPIAGAQHIIAVRQNLKVQHVASVHHLPSDLTAAEYLILTHPIVRQTREGIDPAKAYAEYRSSPKGGAYKTAIVNIQDVYDHFNSGEAGPAGIRNMIAHLTSQGNLKFLMIVGRSVDPQTSRKTTDPNRKDLIPNAGWPGSDLALATQIDRISPDIPVVAIGRINASTADEVAIYLQKVKQMEAEPSSASWRKRVVHLSGGRTYKEIDAFSSYMQTFSETITTSHLAAQVESKTKTTEDPVEQLPIHETLNKGVALVTLFGHSGIDITDVDIGYISDSSRNYQNKPFYPAVIANGCASGSIFYSDKTISSDWIFTPDKGAVLFLAHTFNGSSSALKNYSTSIYKVMADTAFSNKPFGTIQLEAIRRNLQTHSTLSDMITSQQMNLHGDPAIRIFPASLPDYTFDSSAIRLSDKYGGALSTWSDSLGIRLTIKNNGRYNKEPYQLTISDSSKQILFSELRNAVAIADTLTIQIKNPYNKPGQLILNAEINPDHKLREESKTNNYFRIIQVIREGGVFPVLPVSEFKTGRKIIELVAQIAPDINTNNIVFEWDSTSTFISPRKQIVPADQWLAKMHMSIPDGYSNVYWRVYIPEYPDRPSISHRIIFNPDYSGFPGLPEGIAFAVTDQNMHLLEGDSIRCKAVFRNITGISFTDSISVKVVYHSPAGISTTLQNIAPVGGYQDSHFSITMPTNAASGQHRIVIHFNQTNLPETHLHNNVLQFSYTVIADLTPPLLFVTIDGRMITDGEDVSASPQLKITLQDENPFLFMTDTTGIAVYLKENCTHCIEKRIWLKNAAIQSGPANQLNIMMSDLPALSPGHYQLRILGHDRSKNRTPEYQINFKVSGTVLVKSLNVAPNPSRTFFRFQFLSQGSFSPQKLVIVITDIYGRIIVRKLHQLQPGISESIWEPANLQSGIYFYRLDKSSGETAIPFSPDVNRSGKLILKR